MARFSPSRLRIRHYALLFILIVLAVYFIPELRPLTSETTAIFQASTTVQNPQVNTPGPDASTPSTANNAPHPADASDIRRQHVLEPPRKSSIANNTLGFGRIFVLNLPSRTDKRDALDLAATLSNVTLTWRDGVDGSIMHEKAIPPAHGGEGEFTKDGEVGCWRGHMNIVREIATSGIGSALILEDDADWDVGLRGQLEDLAGAVKDITSKLPGDLQACTSSGADGGESPFGNCWDILWIGHCGGWAPRQQFSGFRSIISGDKTVPPVFDIQDFTNDIAKSALEGNPCSAHVGRKLKHNAVCKSPELQLDERIVQYKPSPICTTGYAISQQGARKMLARLGGLSLSDIDANMDTELNELCRGDKDISNRSPMQCLGVVPPIILPHRPKGSKTSDSDITEKIKGQTRDLGVTEGVVYSTRMNVEALIKGEKAESQYILDEKSKEWRYKVEKEYRYL